MATAKINRKDIEKVVSESDDLITALEHVGAMYCIPPSHILQDDSQQSIKVVNDTIIAPNRKNTIANTQSIVCAIGSVLDYISQRIDDKLDDFQSDAFDQSKLDEAKASSDPSKGTVISRHVTDEGDEILVYDSGIVDRPNTRAALMKVAELKRNGVIPEKKEVIQEKPKSTYFTDADDISNDVDTGDSSTPELSETDVSGSVQESAMLLDLISEYNNTTHLGYDIFSEMGYDIKPNDQFIQEAKTKNKKPKTIKPEDIKHMKFDNKHILNAVKYFNAARAEQKDVKYAKDLNIQKLVNSTNYNKGVRELETQFDCHIAYKWTKNSEGYENAGTLNYDPDKTYAHEITVSKSKGFQLHGMGIFIVVDEYGLFSDAPVEQSMFGQALVAVSLHEIFHNIANAIRSKTDSFIVNTATTMSLMISARSAKRKREIMNRYCDAIANMGIVNINNPVRKKIFIKQMMLMSSLHNPTDIKSVIDKTSDIKTEEEIDKTILVYASYIDKKKKEIKNARDYKTPFALMVINLAMGVINLTVNTGSISAASILLHPVATAAATSFAGIAAGLSLTASFLSFLMYAMRWSFDRTYRKVEDQYKKGKAFEESWCDMFAGIYNFPVVFYIKSMTDKNKNFTPNTVGNVDKLNQLAGLEKELHTLLFTTYPTNSERNHAAAKIAENALKQKGLDSATRKYLTWIKDNFSSMLDTDIEKEDVNTTYDPNRAGDVDKHIQDIINQGNVTVTESFA
jgi:hypothetical protein